MSMATYIELPLDFPNNASNEHFKMLCPRVQIGQTGTKLLFVLDRVATEEIRGHKLLESHATGGTFERMLEVARSYTDTPIREFAAVNFQEVRIGSLQGPARDRATAACWKRVMDFAVRYKPDVIVFFGRGPADQAWPDERDANPILIGRVRPFTYGEHAFKGMMTLSVQDWAPTRPEFYNFAMLVGLVIRHTIDAIEGRNRRTINIPPNIRPIMLDTMPRFRKFLGMLQAAKTPCIDTETDNLNRIDNRLLSMQFCLDGKTSFFLPMRHKDSPWLAEEYNEIVTSLRDWFERGATDYVIYHGAKFDIGQILVQLGVRYHAHRAYDTQAGEFQLDENRKWLKELGFEGYSLVALEGVYGFRRPDGVMGKEDRANMAMKSLPEIALYGQYDVLTPWHICRQQQDEAASRGEDYDGFMLAVADQMSDMLISFAGMERYGLLADKTHLLRMQSKESEFVKRLRAVDQQFRASAAAQETNEKLCAQKGIPLTGLYGSNVWMFNINQEASRQTLYFDVLGLEPVSETKVGGSTDKNFQKQYKDVPEVALLGEHSKVKKLYTAFVQSLWRRLAADPDARKDGRIRCTFNYLYVLTGRSSASDPNLQQIPSRDSLAKPIKRTFIAEFGKILLKVDYAAHEVRGWGNISGDQEIAKTFRVALALRRAFRVAGDNSKAALEEELKAKGDIHIINVKFFYGQDVDKKHPLRQAIKNVVFGVIYGKGANSLAVDINDSVERAKELIKKLFERWAVGGRWLRQVQVEAKRTFRAVSPLGRVRHLWGYLHHDSGVHAAMDRRGPNSVIQGNASDLGYQAMGNLSRLVWNLFTKRGVDLSLRTLNAVHDSGTHDCDLEETPLALYLIEHAMTTEVARRCRDVFSHPLIVDLEIDVEAGGSEGSMNGWDMRSDSVLKLVTDTMDWQEKELGYNYSPEERQRIISATVANNKIVAEARRREIIAAMDDPGNVSYRRLITEQNVAKFTWMLGSGKGHATPQPTRKAA